MKPRRTHNVVRQAREALRIDMHKLCARRHEVGRAAYGVQSVHPGRSSGAATNALLRSLPFTQLTQLTQFVTHVFFPCLNAAAAIRSHASGMLLCQCIRHIVRGRGGEAAACDDR